MTERGTGRTKAQMMAAPYRAYYVWVNGDLSYPKTLASHVGRQDLRIVPLRHFEEYGKCQGIPRGHSKPHNAAKSMVPA